MLKKVDECNAVQVSDTTILNIVSAAGNIITLFISSMTDNSNTALLPIKQGRQKTYWPTCPAFCATFYYLFFTF